MDTLTQGILTLLRSGLTGEQLSLPEGFDPEQAYAQLCRHQIQPICYLGGLACGLPKDSQVMQWLFKDYCAALLYSEQQAAVLDVLFAKLDEAGVDYMPLKGYLLKGIYPKPEMRTMGDADVLIRVEQYDAICPIMTQLGFTENRESDHELIWQKGQLVVELHKRLIPSYNKDYYDYYADGWQLARQQQGTRYAMSQEDELVYLVTHFAKHYRDGGIGCRHVCDLWLYEKAYPQLNRAYLEVQLNKLHLLEFYRNIRGMLLVWFKDGQTDDKARLLTSVIFQSGSWGERSSQILASALREKQGNSNVLLAKLKRLWRLTFLPLWKMKQKYFVLEKCPALLPVFWVVRVVDILFFTKGKMTQHAREFAYMTRQRVEEYEQSLHYVGLDFDFEEPSDK